MSQSIITLGIGGTADLDWFVTSGLHSNPDVTRVVNLTGRRRDVSLVARERDRSLTGRARDVSLTVKER